MNLPPRILRLLALGALGACAAFVALYALVVFITIPRAGAGIDATHATITWISVGGMVLALIAVHVVIARQLWKNEPRLP